MSEVEGTILIWLVWLVIVLGMVIIGTWMDWRACFRYRSIREFDFDGEDRR